MRARSRQLSLFVSLAAVIVVAAMVIPGCGGGSGGSGDLSGAAEVNKRFAGIPQDGVTLGDPKAPETVIEFADLQCPYCKQFAEDVLPDLVDKQVRPGKLKLELRLIAIVGDRVQSTTAATAAASASMQNKIWQFSDLFYINQGVEESGYVTDDFITSIYDAIPGLNVEKAQKDRTSAAAQAMERENLTLAEKYGVSSTPSLFLVSGKGKPVPIEVSNLDYASFEEALAAARAK